MKKFFGLSMRGNPVLIEQMYKSEYVNKRICLE